MYSNPNNAIGTNGAYGGRTSVNAFNDVLGALSRGVISGWACSPNSGMTVSLGGDGTTRDVAVAEDNAGNRTTVNNISGSPVNVTIDSAPAVNSRIDLIVAYVDNPPQGVTTTADNPQACGIIAVKGTASSTPVAPNDSAIRTAITGDGASGTTAYYVILAQILVTSGTTDIVAGNITAGSFAQVGTNQVADSAITDAKLAYSALTGSVNVKTVETTVNTGYNVTINLMRIGNLVIASCGGIITDPSAVDTTLTATVPSGYRPYSTSKTLSAPYTMSSGGVSFNFSTAGAIAMRRLNKTGGYYYGGVATYVTKDAWP